MATKRCQTEAQTVATIVMSDTMVALVLPSTHTCTHAQTDSHGHVLTSQDNEGIGDVLSPAKGADVSTTPREVLLKLCPFANIAVYNGCCLSWATVVDVSI